MSTYITMILTEKTLTISFVFLFLPFLLSLGSCSPPPKTSPNVILISLDTLRKDALGTYNKNNKSDSPNIDNFAKDSVVFDQAYAPMPFTPASHMTMLTGVLPLVHNVSHPIDNSTVNILPLSIPTLAQILQKDGYTTHGIFSNIWLREGFGSERGFDSYNQIWGMSPYAEQITRKATAFINSKNKPTRPFFLFLHYYDVHSDFHPSAPPYTTTKKFQIPGYDTSANNFCYPSGPCATQYLQTVNHKKEVLEPNNINLLRKLYQGGVAYTDESLAQLITALKQKDLYDNSLIIITSDHGEEFAEHSLFLHEQLYEENSNIPLIIKFPKNKHAGTLVRSLVELADILPTVLDITGLPLPPIVQGKSLVKSIAKEPKKDTLILLMQDKLIKTKFALRYKHYKFIHDFSSNVSELYDLNADPEEFSNLTKINPSLVNDLSKKLTIEITKNIQLAGLVQKQDNGIKSTTLTDKEKKRLKSLGYL